MATKLSPRPETVKKIRLTRHLTRQDVAEAAHLDRELLAEVESTPTELSRSRVTALADALAVPPQFLFYKRVLVENTIVDFRTVGNRPAVLTPAGLSRLERARSIINYLDDPVFDELGVSAFKPAGPHASRRSAIKFLRSVLDLHRHPNGEVDPTATFRDTRVSLERLGIIVLCDRIKSDDFRGFCLYERSRVPIIFVNTWNQRPTTKLFTLAHEAVHAFLGATGVSDPTLLHNKLEQFCNNVVASVMMPEEQFSSSFRNISSRDPRTIANQLSRIFGVSKQAAAIRVEELGLDNAFYSRWHRALPLRIPPIEEEDAQEDEAKGGGIGAQVSRFGYWLPSVLGRAITKEYISILDAYRLTNLKPNTIDQLSDIGSRRLER